ncbi:MAG: metallophosphoesterase [Actinomycetes bacterium]
MTTGVGIAGDWHGATPWALDCVRALPEDVRTLIHLGDFGLIGSGWDRYLFKVNREASRRDIDIKVVPGNHENHDYIARQPLDGDGMIIAAERVKLFPRGYRFTIEQVSFCAVGGAVSVDQGHRTPFTSYWPAEELDDATVAQITNQGHADVLLTHDAPLGALPPTTMSNRELVEWAGSEIASKAYLHHRRVRALTDGLSPRLHLHGHFHVRHTQTVTWPGNDAQGYTCDIESLACEGMEGNMVMLIIDDTSTTVTPIPTPPAKTGTRVDTRTPIMREGTT